MFRHHIKTLCMITALLLTGCNIGVESAAEDDPEAGIMLPEGDYALLERMTTAEWDWFFPFRYGHYNPNGALYNQGTEACTLLGIDASVTESALCDIYSLAHFEEAVLAYNRYASDAGLPEFLNEGSLKQQAEELAAFFSNISRETSGSWIGATVEPGGWIEDDPLIGMRVWKGGLYWTEEIGYTTNPDGTVLTGGISYVDSSSRYTPVPDRSYHGRGPIQLTWNYNYGYFSEWLYTNHIYPEVITSADILLQNPALVNKDAVISFLSAIWFWMTSQGTKPSAHDVILGKVIHVSTESSDRGLPPLRAEEGVSIPVAEGASERQDVMAYRLGSTINIINGEGECDGAAAWHPGPVQRVSYYEAYTAYLNTRYGAEATATSAGYISEETVNEQSSDVVRFATCYAQMYYGQW